LRLIQFDHIKHKITLSGAHCKTFTSVLVYWSSVFTTKNPPWTHRCKTKLNKNLEISFIKVLETNSFATYQLFPEECWQLQLRLSRRSLIPESLDWFPSTGSTCWEAMWALLLAKKYFYFCLNKSKFYHWNLMTMYLICK
jgi:hypothetical protein